MNTTRRSDIRKPTGPHRRAWPVSLLVLIFLVESANAALTPEDFAAISETGLTALTGEQGGDYPAKDYVIVETMTVPQGETVRFAAGTRLFFHANARITVKGSLVCEGITPLPVTLGKLSFELPRLSSRSKTVFDKTSIFIYRGGDLSLRHVAMGDSTISIRLTDTLSTFSLDSVICANTRFTLTDTSMLFPAKSIVTCSKGPGSFLTPCTLLLADVAATDGASKPVFALRPVVAGRVALAIGSGAAAGIWIYHNRKARDSMTKYDNATTVSQASRYREDNHRSIRYRNFAALAAACGITAFTLTFFIGGER